MRRKWPDGSAATPLRLKHRGAPLVLHRENTNLARCARDTEGSCPGLKRHTEAPSAQGGTQKWLPIIGNFATHDVAVFSSSFSSLYTYYSALEEHKIGCTAVLNASEELWVREYFGWTVIARRDVIYDVRRRTGENKYP